jgi:hypothetical protein
MNGQPQQSERSAPARRWRRSIGWRVAVAAAAFGGPLGAVAQAAAPTTRTPALAVTGSAVQGDTLTANGGSPPGSWDNAPTTIVDQWYDCPTNAVSTSCTAVSANGTPTSYTLSTGDPVGDYVYLAETAGNADGSATQDSNLIGPIAAAPPPAPANLTAPQISGTYTAGQVLTESGDTWSGDPTSFAYQWLRCTNGACDKPITNGGDAQTYTLKPKADDGHTLAVEVTATNAGGSTTATSAQTPVITAAVPVPVNQGAPTISGTTEVGQTLTEGAASWSNSPTSTAIQWRRCDSNSANCQDIAGATAQTYTLTNDDAGAMMQVAESATNAGGTTTAYSGFAGPVTIRGITLPPNASPGSTPTVSGTAQFGLPLTASGAQFDGNPGTFSYQWMRCNAVGCAQIPGATDITYTPTSADVGDSVAVAETATNSAGTSNTVVSPRTAAITAPSTTTVQTSASAPVAGQAVTLIATVTSAAGSVKPSGSVSFQADGATIPGCTGVSLGTATPTALCQTAFGASVANVTGAYSAAQGTFVTGSTSPPTTLTIGRAPTTVSVVASAHVSLGTKTTYTATIQPPAGSALTPTGSVTFTDGAKTIRGCAAKTVAADRARCSVTYRSLTRHRIAVSYSGDANFAPSASLTSHVIVRPQTPSGIVAAVMYWSFAYSPSSTRVKSLTATGLSAGTRITLTCHGGGCPFATRAVTVAAHGRCGRAAAAACVAAPSFNLTSLLHRAPLHVGARLIVALTHRGWVGKYYRFTIRAGRRPSTEVSCLAVNGTRPGVGCIAQ